MKINIGSFRNTSNPLKLHQITLFHTGSSTYYNIIIQFTKVLSHKYADDALTSNAYKGVNFHCRDLKFQTLFPTP